MGLLQGVDGVAEPSCNHEGRTVAALRVGAIADRLNRQRRSRTATSATVGHSALSWPVWCGPLAQFSGMRFAQTSCRLGSASPQPASRS